VGLGDGQCKRNIFSEEKGNGLLLSEKTITVKSVDSFNANREKKPDTEESPTEYAKKTHCLIFLIN